MADVGGPDVTAPTCGWLHKKAPLGSLGERRRWFSLDAPRRELVYYKDASPASRRLGCIRLEDVSALDDSQAANHAAFDLVTAYRVYELRAGSIAEASEWVAKLRPLVGGANAPASAASCKRPTLLRPFWRAADKASVNEPLIQPPSEPPASCEEQPPHKTGSYQPAVPWCVETVWLDESQQDAALDITADLGQMPEGGFKHFNLLLSDGTKMMVDCDEFNCTDGEFHEVAVAGDKVMLAKISKSWAPVPSAPGSPAGPAWLPRWFGMSSGCALGAAAGVAAARALPSEWAALALALVLLLAAAVGEFVAAKLRRADGCVDSSLAQAEAASPPDAEAGERATYKLCLRAAVKTSGDEAPPVGGWRGAAERSGRLSHPERRSSSALGRLLVASPSDDAPKAAERPLQMPLPLGSGGTALERDKDWVVFTGRWKLNLQRSDDPSEMLKAMGVPMLARIAVARYARTVIIEQDGLEWTETMLTPVATKTVTMTLDGSPHVEMSPVDKATLTMVSQYEEGGQCVVTRSRSSDGRRSQVVKRYLLDSGRTYQTINVLSVGAREITTHNYFDRME